MTGPELLDTCLIHWYSAHILQPFVRSGQGLTDERREDGSGGRTAPCDCGGAPACPQVTCPAPLAPDPRSGGSSMPGAALATGGAAPAAGAPPARDPGAALTPASGVLFGAYVDESGQTGSGRGRVPVRGGGGSQARRAPDLPALGRDLLRPRGRHGAARSYTGPLDLTAARRRVGGHVGVDRERRARRADRRPGRCRRRDRCADVPDVPPRARTSRSAMAPRRSTGQPGGTTSRCSATAA